MFSHRIARNRRPAYWDEVIRLVRRWRNRVRLQVELLEDRSMLNAAGLAAVVGAEPDYIVHTAIIPNDTCFGSLYGLNNTGQAGGRIDADIDAPEAWDVTTGSTKIVVAVIDTGVDYRHPDLYLNIWINQGEIPTSLGLQDADGDTLITFRDLNHSLNAGLVANVNGNTYIDAGDLLVSLVWENGVDNDGNGRIDDLIGWDFVNNDNDPFDDNGHGTHVSGTIGAMGNNGVGVAGVNWQVQIAALKFLSASGSGATSGAVSAINYAVGENIRISNNSWSGGGFSTSLFNAIQNSQSIGHVFVAAAGNANNNNDFAPSYPASFNLANIISVAATDRNDNRASFSNYGASTVDLGAPGVSILSTTPNGSYSTFNGTSMAAPHVAGVAALVLSQNPTLTYSEVISQILNNVDPLTSLNGITATGGRLNAFQALGDGTPPPDSSGPHITAAVPNASGANPVSSVRVTFNEAINPDSFLPEDVSLTGPGGGSIAITGVTPVGTGNTQFDVTFATQSAVGTYTVVIGPDIADTAGNPMNQDQDGFNGEPADQFAGTFTISSTTFFQNTTPLTLPDFSTRTSTITVGQGFTITDLDVRINITHTWDSDLRITLRGPDGTVITLVNRRGGSGDNFNNTRFSDEASLSIANGFAPFAGAYRPENPLSSFDSKNAAGAWSLTIQDLAFFDSGRLNSWSLTFEAAGGGIASVLNEVAPTPSLLFSRAAENIGVDGVFALLAAQPQTYPTLRWTESARPAAVGSPNDDSWVGVRDDEEEETHATIGISSEADEQDASPSDALTPGLGEAGIDLGE
jgi:subtilisin family serine protease